MSAIAASLKQQRGFIAYLTVGDGGIERSKQAIHALIQGGVTILELGLPFSDPIADGPVIQAATLRALENGTSLDDVLELISQLKKEIEIPIILFTYYNPILNAGPTVYARAQKVGVDGILIVDLPVEESVAYRAACKRYNLDPIFLISPTSSQERIKKIASYSQGMLYYVTRSGTTGIRGTLPLDLKQKLKEIRALCSLPVVAGFGISNRDMAAAILKYADGFVVGSLFVEAIARHDSSQQIAALAQSIDPR